jgi:hypothetical protein
MADTLQPATPTVRIALTPDQRPRVRQRTGYDVEEISVHDPDGWISLNMPTMPPVEVEKLAYRVLDRQADADALAAQQAAEEAEAQKAREEAEKKLKAIEAEVNKEAQEIQAAVAAAFAVEAEAADLARQAAKAALAAALAAQKKK